MAAEAIVSTVLEQLTSIIGKEVVQEVRLVVDVRKEIEKLTSNFRAIKAVLVDAEKRQVETGEETPVGLWLDKLKDASYDMDDVLDEWNTAILKSQIEGVENAQTPKKNVRFLFSSPCFCFRKIALRHDIGVKIKEINENLDSIAVEKDKYNLNAIRSIEEPQRLKTTSFIEVSEIRGRDKEKNNLVNKLLSERNQSSMGDRGQTTIASGSWEMGWIFVRSHIDLSYKMKFVATNACAEHWRRTFYARLISAGEFYPSKRSNSILVVVGIFDFTKVLSAQIPFWWSWGYMVSMPLTNNEMLSCLLTEFGVRIYFQTEVTCWIRFAGFCGLLDIEANVMIEIVQANWYGSKSNSCSVVMGTLDFNSIIWFQCSDKEWIGVAALLEFTVLLDVLLYLNREMEIMKVSYQSNAVGGTSNKVEDEIAVK
ncbi:hypothetical protein EZV62_028188 [Acer yangbiense]|uniref:Disease resistance N-terminal domain-containing protein n=1 Tax=Acer yangbiense TaxID=1000413 RepID=A0A5C7GNX7_9ROSI|nr:hypothetical protein EZV62_028188 [Acer yangbiense]